MPSRYTPKQTAMINRHTRQVLVHGSSSHRGAIRDANHAVKNPARIVSRKKFLSLKKSTAKSYDAKKYDDGTNKIRMHRAAHSMYGYRRPTIDYSVEEKYPEQPKKRRRVAAAPTTRTLRSRK